MAKKLTEDAKLAEIFPPDDLIDYDAWEAGEAVLRGSMQPRTDPLTVDEMTALAATGRLPPDPAIEQATERDEAKLTPVEMMIIARRGYNPVRMSRTMADFVLNDADANKRDAKAERERQVYPPPMTSAELKNTVYPPIRFILDKLIREGIPQTVDGDGGIGKTSVTVGTTIARAAGVAIFGKATIQGPCLFVTHEDDKDDLQAMATAYADYLDVDLETLPVEWWSLLENDITLAIVDDTGGWKRGPFYDAFKSKLKSSPPGLFVVLDCRSDVVQMNEILREPPNTFYKTVLTPLCKRYGCTILVLCHPSKAAMVDGSWYSGGTGNKSALRNKLVMKLEDPKNDNGPRLFGVLKRNRGDRDVTMIRLSFDVERGIYVADDDASVQEGERAAYELVIRAVLELIGKDIPVLRTDRGDGRSPDDVADYINRADYKPESPITGKVVRTMLKRAEETGALVYVKGASKTKAGYRGRIAGDFE